MPAHFPSFAINPGTTAIIASTFRRFQAQLQLILARYPLQLHLFLAEIPLVCKHDRL